MTKRLTTLIPLQEVTSAPRVLSGRKSVGVYQYAELWIRLGRLTTDNFTSGVIFRVELSPDSTGLGRWYPATVLVSHIGSGIDYEAILGVCDAGQPVIGMASTTGFNVGDVVFIQNDDISLSEWGRIKTVTADTSVTLEDNLVNAQTGMAIRNCAECYTTVKVNVKTARRVRVVVDGSGTGKNFAVEVVMMTYNDVTETETSDRFDRRTDGRIRKPTLSVLLEKQGDITNYIKRVEFKRSFTDSLNAPAYGRGRISILDTDGVFVENSKCTIEIGDKLKIWVGFKGEHIARFKGVVYDPRINNRTHEISLGIADYGWILRNAQTHGDYSDYNTPKLLIDRLCQKAFIGTPVYQNEAGDPSAFVFGNTTLSRRPYWDIIHGALMGIFYIFYIDADGALQCKRRDHFNDVDTVFDDSNLTDITHVRMAKFINSKSIGHAPDFPTWGPFTVKDGVRFGQTRQTSTNEISKARYGESSDYHTDELLQGYSNAIKLAETMRYFSYPRQIYELTAPAHPQLKMMDRIFVRSERRNVKGKFIIMGISESLSPGYYNNTFTLLSEREVF